MQLAVALKQSKLHFASEPSFVKLRLTFVRCQAAQALNAEIARRKSSLFTVLETKREDRRGFGI